MLESALCVQSAVWRPKVAFHVPSPIKGCRPTLLEQRDADVALETYSRIEPRRLRGRDGLREPESLVPQSATYPTPPKEARAILARCEALKSVERLEIALLAINAWGGRRLARHGSPCPYWNALAVRADPEQNGAFRHSGSARYHELPGRVGQVSSTILELESCVPSL